MWMAIRLGLLVVGAFVVAVAIDSPPRDAEASQLGCCMKRESESSPWEQIRGKIDVKQCKKLNEKDDEDSSLLKPEGRIMWSIKC